MSVVVTCLWLLLVTYMAVGEYVGTDPTSGKEWRQRVKRSTAAVKAKGNGNKGKVIILISDMLCSSCFRLRYIKAKRKCCQRYCSRSREQCIRPNRFRPGKMAAIRSDHLRLKSQ